MKTTLLVPTLNEIDGLRAIMPQIDRSWCDQILIVDGNSTDGSQKFAIENGYELVVQKGKGMRNAYISAYPHIKGDIIITFSPDWNSLSEKIPPLIDRIKEGYDMVIVSRYLEGARSYDDDVLTKYGNWFFTSIINFLFNGKYTDAMVIFRAYKKDLLDRLNILSTDHSSLWNRYIGRRVSIEPLLSVRCAKFQMNYSEIPGDEPKRLSGVRKMMPFRTGSACLFQIIHEFFKPSDERGLR